MFNYIKSLLVVEALFVVEGLALTNVNYLPSIINCNSSFILRKSYAKAYDNIKKWENFGIIKSRTRGNPKSNYIASS